MLVNPYKKKVDMAISGGSSGTSNSGGMVHHSPMPLFFPFMTKMGCQSQNRMGAIKKTLKLGTKRKSKYKRKDYIQAAVNGGRAFDHTRDCIVCVALARKARLVKSGLMTNIPHRPHDLRCPKNRKTKGLSIRTVEVEKIAQENIARNNAPITTCGGPVGTTAAQKYQAIFGAAAINNRKDHPTISNEKIGRKELLFDQTRQATPLATTLRNHLDFAMEKAVTEHVPTAHVPSMPLAIYHMVDYITAQYDHKKPRKQHEGYNQLPNTATFEAAHSRYRQFFQPGSCIFSFPVECSDKPPSQYYHSITGHSIFHIDWELTHPGTILYCYACKGGKLHHDRTNFKKHGTLFPVWMASGEVMWGVVMKYVCSTCGEKYAGNDGRLLSMLPANVRSAYPVEPRYATGAFHFSTTLSDLLEATMKTYGNGNFFCKTMMISLARCYERKLEAYLASEEPINNYVSFEDWIGQTYPPSGASIRLLYEIAERSPLNSSGISNFDRYKREIAGVGDAGIVAIDWTFQVVKNYILPGSKACFTMNTSTGEIAALGIVKNTSVDQISHMVEQMVRNRPAFHPKVIYTDTWPHNNSFWKGMFGISLVGRLGLFHLMKRITDTLNTACELYWETLAGLKSALYRYNENDEENLLLALKDGSLSQTNVGLSNEQIQSLKLSKRWKQRYDRYLRKVLLAPETIKTKLDLWVKDNKNKLDSNGRSVLSSATEKIVAEQMKKVQYIQDVPGIDVYKLVNPGPRSKHKLPQYLSCRPESSLEKFHEKLAHFGNTGMSAGLADCLTLRGTAEHNLVIRHKLSFKQQRIIPAYLEDTPFFLNHHHLSYLNQMAEKKGLQPVFPMVKKLGDNAGEKFLSEYFFAQEERNRTHGSDPLTKKCLCTLCHGNALQYSDVISKEGTATEGGTPQHADAIANSDAIDTVSVVGGLESDGVVDQASQIVSVVGLAENRYIVEQGHSTPGQTLMAVPSLPGPSLPAPIFPSFKPHMPFTTSLGWISQPWMFPTTQVTNVHAMTGAIGNSWCGCRKNQEYHHRKMMNGGRVFGRIPHDKQCPSKKNYI